MRDISAKLFGLCALCALVACSGGPDGDEATTSPAKSFGLMSVTYTYDRALSAKDADASDLELLTTAQFVRYSALKRGQVERLLALPLDPSKLPAEESCKVEDLTVELEEEGMLDEQAEPANVELLEAGNLRVETGTGAKITLVPKHFPGLLPFISGVVYGEAQSDGVAAASAVLAATEGSEVVGAFSVRAESPALPRVQSIASQPLDAPIVLRKGDPAQLRWEAVRGAENDVLYVEVRMVDAPRDEVLRCRLRENGSFTLPGDLLAELGHNKAGKLQIDLARLRRASFTTSGLERGELRVTARDRVMVELK